jgi:hypothetical protein
MATLKSFIVLALEDSAHLNWTGVLAFGFPFSELYLIKLSATCITIFFNKLVCFLCYKHLHSSPIIASKEVAYSCRVLRTSSLDYNGKSENICNEKHSSLVKTKAKKF